MKKLRELLEYHIVNRTDAVIVTGTTGESATMSDEEKTCSDKIFLLM
ncbi:dihydrodipicolinate synthase family protein [Fusobacterium sp. SB021]